MDNEATIRIPFELVKSELQKILLTYGFKDDDASLCARLFAETTRDGVYSHGLNRFPRFIEYIEEGYVIPQKKLVVVESFDSHEVWDGQLGPGNINAYAAMERALSLAKKRAIGIVALRNTNHWMRGGTYGWQAADEGSAAICMTNTEPNMPPWGGSVSKIGNNPLIISFPHPPNHIVLDMAMSQFSFGKMENLRLNNQKLPFDGGFTENGQLTNDPDDIIHSKQALPMGYWKGSGLSMMIDLLVSVLSGGNSTTDIGKKKKEYAVSQLFIAIDLESAGKSAFATSVISQLKDQIHQSKPMDEKGRIYYPGERTYTTRQENLKNGLPVNKKLWDTIVSLR
jgi:3-dehydro-L-gulonate 2-dehydrogenase